MGLTIMKIFDLMIRNEKIYIDNKFGRRWTGAEN